MKLKLNNVRLAFPAIFEPKAVNEDSKPRFSAVFIMGPNHPALIDIENAFITVANAKWGAKGPETLTMLRKTLKTCLHDGEEKAKHEGFLGNKYITAAHESEDKDKVKLKLRIVDRDGAPLGPEDGRPYAGCYVNAIVDIWAQKNKYGERINASLMGVQFLRDGEALGGAPIASEDDFEDLTVGANVEDFA